MEENDIFHLIDQLTPNELLTHEEREKRRNDREVTIRAILLHLEKHPDAAKEKDEKDCTPLHIACGFGAPLEVVSTLLGIWPDGAKEKDCFGCTPLDTACIYDAPLDVISTLLSAWPDGAKEKDSGGGTPLHTTCRFRAPVEVVRALLSIWPDGAKEKDEKDCTPLHIACSSGAQLEVVSALLSTWPDGGKTKDAYGRTPLHTACIFGASFEVTTLLLDMWLQDKDNKKPSGVVVLEKYASVSTSPNSKQLLFHVSSLYSSKTDNPPPVEIMAFFLQIKLWNGIVFLLDRYPNVVKTMDLDSNIMAYFISMVGHRCKLTTMWKIICNEQDLLEGV